MSQPPYPPYPGQGEPEQPYGAQPGREYPPTQQYGQPAGQQPQSAPPSYSAQPGQPSSGPPGYPPSYSGQPPYPGFSGQPGFPQSGPTPPRKSRTMPLVLLCVVLALLLFGGGSYAIYLAGRDKTDKTDPSPAATGTTAEATDEPTGGTITITEPRTLGGRAKLDDPQFDDAKKKLKEGLGAVPGATTTVGAIYGNVLKQDIVVLAAAAAPVDDPEEELDGTFSGASSGGLDLSAAKKIDPGPLGGSAQCSTGSASGVKLVLCGWADKGSVGWIIWYFKSAISTAKAEFPKLRAEVEKSS
jgi:hypothetical protein